MASFRNNREIYFCVKSVHSVAVTGANVTVNISGTLHQRSPTGGPRTTDSPRENFGGPWRNLDIICNFYVYYTYFKQAATNITLIILL
jgi:hypothetical protein